MKQRPLGPAEVFYRVHDPRWAYSPTSGGGAERAGARFNRPGVPALYVSRTPETAIAEYQQEDPILSPGTLVGYRVTLTSMVDFEGGYDPEVWDPAWMDWDCDWRTLFLRDRIEPPSWLLGDAAMEAGAHGIPVPVDAPSRRHKPGDLQQHTGCRRRARGLHPNGALPVDQSSWPRQE